MGEIPEGIQEGLKSASPVAWRDLRDRMQQFLEQEVEPQESEELQHTLSQDLAQLVEFSDAGAESESD
jgi:hypothetical protein